MITEKEYAQISKILYRYIQNDEQVEDCIQNALIQILQSSQTKSIHNLKQYIIQSAINDFSRFKKSSYSKQTIFSTDSTFDLVVATNGTPEKRLLEKEEGKLIKKAIGNLTEKERHGLSFLYKKFKQNYGKSKEPRYNTYKANARIAVIKLRAALGGFGVRHYLTDDETKVSYENKANA